MDDCLYRCGSDAASTQVYHVYPASASNWQITLEAGIVCDKCNAYFGELENYFVHHHPGAAAKLVELQETRKGKPPKYLSQAGAATREPDGDGGVQFKVPLSTLQFEPQANGDIVMKGVAKAQDFDAVRISRVLGKIAVETIYAHGWRPEINLDPSTAEFEPLIRYVRFRHGQPQFVWFAYKHVSGDESQPRIVSFHGFDNEFLGTLVMIQLPGIHYVFPVPPFLDPQIVRLALPDWTFVETQGLHPSKDLDIAVQLVLLPPDEAESTNADA